MQTNITGLFRSRTVAVVLLVLFSGLSLAHFVRGGELGYTHFFTFAMTGFILADVLRHR